jgi:hypothetical protein
MNELQSIRRMYEQPVEAALGALTTAIPVFTDNRYYAEDDATSEFALCRLNFGLMTEPSLATPGCGDSSWIRGTLIVEIFTPKGNGPGRPQAAAEAVWDALCQINTGLSPELGIRARVGQISGPTFQPLQGRPHYMARVSCAISCTYMDPALTAFLVDDQGFQFITDDGSRVIVRT